MINRRRLASFAHPTNSLQPGSACQWLAAPCPKARESSSRRQILSSRSFSCAQRKQAVLSGHCFMSAGTPAARPPRPLTRPTAPPPAAGRSLSRMTARAAPPAPGLRGGRAGGSVELGCHPGMCLAWVLQAPSAQGSRPVACRLRSPSSRRRSGQSTRPTQNAAANKAECLARPARDVVEGAIPEAVRAHGTAHSASAAVTAAAAAAAGAATMPVRPHAACKAGIGSSCKPALPLTPGSAAGQARPAHHCSTQRALRRSTGMASSSGDCTPQQYPLKHAVQPGISREWQQPHRIALRRIPGEQR